MPRKKGQLIRGCQPGSIAEELDLAAGDRLIAIDGQPVRDVFDYRLRQLAEELIVRIEHPDGAVVDYEIEKDEDEDLGLEFEEALLDECTHCHNKCVFCFIDQLPKGLRKTLYFKDDDLRLTFLTGNYVTLTNITDQELDRLIAYRFSPMNISVHTTDPELRIRMMKNPKSGQIMERLERIAAAGIALNTQIVLCPDWNDKDALEKTLHDLSTLRPSVQSIAIVPVGVTRFREENNLAPMHPFTPAECRSVIETVQRYQAHFLQEANSRILYASDEFYLRGGVPLPAASDYDDFPQLENGVGMASLFAATLKAHLSGEQPIPAREPLYAEGRAFERQTRGRIWLVTGTLAGPILESAAQELGQAMGIPVTAAVVTNHFFGDTITVTGLLTGQDVIRQLKPRLQPGDQILIPSCMLKADSPVFLDDITLEALANELAVPVYAVRADAEGLVSGLNWLHAKRSAPL